MSLSLSLPLACPSSHNPTQTSAENSFADHLLDTPFAIGDESPVVSKQATAALALISFTAQVLRHFAAVGEWVISAADQGLSLLRVPSSTAIMTN